MGLERCLSHQRSVAFAEDPGLIPSIHMVAHNHLYLLSLEIWHPVLIATGTRDECSAHTGETFIHMKWNLKKIKITFVYSGKYIYTCKKFEELQGPGLTLF